MLGGSSCGPSPVQAVESIYEPTVQQNVEETKVTDEVEALGTQEFSATASFTPEPTETSTPEIKGEPSPLFIAHGFSTASCGLDKVGGYLELGSDCSTVLEGDVPLDTKALSSEICMQRGKDYGCCSSYCCSV